MTSETSLHPPGGELVVYEAPDGAVRVDVRLDRETVWLTQQQMAKLFGRDRSVVTRAHSQCIQRRRAGPPGNQCKICTSSIRGRPNRLPRDQPLQPRSHHIGRLPGQLPKRRPLSAVGHPHPARAPGPRLHPQPAAPRRTRTQGSPRHAGPAGQHAPQPGAGGYQPGKFELTRGTRVVRHCGCIQWDPALRARNWITSSIKSQAREMTRRERLLGPIRRES